MYKKIFMESQEKKQHGGKRENSGRKKTITKKILFGAPLDVVEILENVPNKTDFIISAIRAYASK